MDTALNIANKFYAPAQPITHTDIPPAIPSPPCAGCKLSGWCRVSGECCVAFNRYQKTGKYKDGDMARYRPEGNATPDYPLYLKYPEYCFSLHLGVSAVKVFNIVLNEH